ncbi:MAG: 50S ribosomal protein L24, partial [Planctomycetota bacterium JB042]
VGEVLSVLPAKQRVIIEGVNMRFKHVKKSQQNPQGGRIERENPIHISNVALYDEKAGRGTRTRCLVTDDGRRHRVSTRTGTDLDA